jgi:hypothetical protein
MLMKTKLTAGLKKMVMAIQVKMVPVVLMKTKIIPTARSQASQSLPFHNLPSRNKARSESVLPPSRRIRVTR